MQTVESVSNRRSSIKFNERYIGRKNNRLTIVGFCLDEYGKKAFECVCDCGNRVIVKPTFWENGRIKSCGCLSEELKVEHSESLDRLRRIYGGMRERCMNPKSRAYRYYGARGISICEQWMNDRDAFIEWALENGYRNDLSIDRINNDGNYEPGNCRWADAKTQANNQRRPAHHKSPEPKRNIEFGGEMYTMKEICEEFGFTVPAVAYRMKTKGMSLMEALTVPRMTVGRSRNESR